jgi:hypothetical protein
MAVSTAAKLRHAGSDLGKEKEGAELDTRTNTTRVKRFYSHWRVNRAGT